MLSEPFGHLDLVSVGDANVDLLCRVDKFPEPDTEVAVGSYDLYAGGDAANVAVAARRLGLSVGYIGCLGRDDYGRFLENELKGEAVDVSCLEYSQVRTGFSFGVVDAEGKRTLMSFKGANSELAIWDRESAYLAGARWIHLSDPTLSVAEKCYEAAGLRGVRVSLDPGAISASRGAEVFRELFRYTEVLLVNRIELFQLAGKTSGQFDISLAASRLLGLGIGMLVVKLGSEGAAVFSKEGGFKSPGYQVNAVDTTGAGDTFDAAFLFGLLRGMDKANACRFACAAGALATLFPGSRAGMPTAEAVFALVNEKEKQK